MKINLNVTNVTGLLLDILIAISCYLLGMMDGVDKERERQELIKLETNKVAIVEKTQEIY
jgi:hypothetical protein